jgi:DNA-binding HxlR family transcriptional regulator
MAKRLRKHFSCPTEFALAVLEGKWKSALLCCLTRRPCRYAELRRLLPGLSDKMLSSRLGSLVEQGLVVRQYSNDRPSVQTYALSELGRTLDEVLQRLSSWATEHADTFGVQLCACRRPAAATLDADANVDPSCRACIGIKMRRHLPIGALMGSATRPHTVTERSARGSPGS